MTVLTTDGEFIPKKDYCQLMSRNGQRITEHFLLEKKENLGKICANSTKIVAERKDHEYSSLRK